MYAWGVEINKSRMWLFTCACGALTFSCDSGDGLDAGADAASDGHVDVLTDTRDVSPQSCVPHEPTMTFVPVQHGTFVMGSPTTEPQRGLYSETQVQVTLTHDFEMTNTEITQAQWTSMCFDNPSGLAPSGGYNDSIGPTFPVGNVTYWDALSFANALSAIDGLAPCYALSGCTGSVAHGLSCLRNDTATNFYECKGYRLPTDAEFEYANRAGTTTATYEGDVLNLPDAGVLCYPDPSIDPIGWCCGADVFTSQAVATKVPNAWGLYDLIGNSMEWVDGSFDGAGYGPNPLTDPFGTVGAVKDERRAGSA